MGLRNSLMSYGKTKRVQKSEILLRKGSKGNMDSEIVKSEMQPVSAKLVVVQGIVQNLPEIIGAIKEIYTLNKKEQLFGRVLQSRLDELNINKENFKVLVEGLTGYQNQKILMPIQKLCIEI